jgi:ElaB/YqjD/DUF883 family membrane-anchored ribosome-binding protein
MKTELETNTQALSDRGEKLSKDIVAAAGEAGSLLKNLGEQKLASAKGALSDANVAVTRRAKAFAGDTDDFVRAYPWKAIGAATGVGIVLGLLLARR